MGVLYAYVNKQNRWRQTAGSTHVHNIRACTSKIAEKQSLQLSVLEKFVYLDGNCRNV